MKLLYVKFSFIGYHSYPNAPTSVAYLRSTHRHVFHVTLYLPVADDVDRELEFHMVKELLEYKLPLFVDLKDTGSCEVISDRIQRMVHCLLSREAIVDVSEDNENGIINIPHDLLK